MDLTNTLLLLCWDDSQWLYRSAQTLFKTFRSTLSNTWIVQSSLRTGYSAYVLHRQCWKVDKIFNLIVFSFPLLYSGQGHGGRSVIKTASVKSKISQGPRLDKF